MAVDQIGTKALVDCSVAAADIAPGTITSAKLAGSIANAKLSNSSITVNGISVALGASGAIPPVQWQSVVVSDGSTVTTMVAGRGYFVNNTSAAGIVKLPASATAGDIVQIKDYAGNFGTNSLTIQRNSHKIQGNTNDSTIGTDRASLILVYVDATKGWLYVNESNVSDFGPAYIAATGGTVTTSSNDKIHVFTGSSNFVVSNAGNSVGSNSVNYLVIAGGGGGGNSNGGGGGAGGFRTSFPVPGSGGLPVSAQTYPITIGGGGAGQPGPDTPGRGTDGVNSVFSTITSSGGGGGGGGLHGHPNNPGGTGGSGGGGATNSGSGGTGNNPPVSPAQGTNGGAGSPSSPHKGGGGGGHTAAGAAYNASPVNGAGGAGTASTITASSVTRGGGGGGGQADGAGPNAGAGGGAAGGQTGGDPGAAGGANTGGGGGGGVGHPGIPPGGLGGNGGSGVVIIRYQYQSG